MPPYRIILFVNRAKKYQLSIPRPHLLGVEFVRRRLLLTPAAPGEDVDDVVKLYFSVGTIAVTGVELWNLYYQLVLGTPDEDDPRFISIIEDGPGLKIGELIQDE